MNNIEKLCINTLRVLAVDQVQQANSGHPGMALGSAPMAYILWANFMKHNPVNSNWHNRDRFVLSAGHASAMLYGLLYLFRYGLTLEDLKQFRQLGSLTPGHPEYRHTVGVEITTGPLGSGIASAVGMAMAEAHLATTFNMPNYPIVDHHTFVLVGDGDLQEGLSAEASSLAGTLQLSKLIVLYDSNDVTIEGKTALSFQENVCQRYESYGFKTFFVSDGNDVDAIAKSIEQAKLSNKPSFIEIKTAIGYGSLKQGLASAHGEPLGQDNVIKLKEFLNYPSLEPFYVPEEVIKHQIQLAEELSQSEKQWIELFDDYAKSFPDKAEKYHEYFHRVNVESLIHDDEFWKFEQREQATRTWSGIVLNRLAVKIPNIFGGSADLAPSTKTAIHHSGSFSSMSYGDKNIHFGIRENAMAAIGNGICVHGGLIPYVSTFLVFSDYLKGMARLSSIEQVPLIYILTHDSISVGEDGPTHQPIEQLTMLRSQPNTIVFRPADAIETAAGYVTAIGQTTTPTFMILCRQNCDVIPSDKYGALRGGYIISPSSSTLPQGCIIATGSEVGLALKAQSVLHQEGFDVYVVSMPSQELFERQTTEYKEYVLPSKLTKRLVVEAGSSMPWFRYVGLHGRIIGIDHFGKSAKGERLLQEFGFTVEHIVSAMKSMLD